MKQRPNNTIPVLQSSNSTHASNESLDIQAKQDAEVYARLLSLGMPSEVTLEDFKRIMSHGSKLENVSKGRANLQSSRIRDLIEFISTHLVGRDEARRLRSCIEQARERHEQEKESRPTSRIKAPVVHITKGVDILDNPMTAAIARRDMAYRNLESTRREYALEMERHGALDKQRRDLVHEIQGKRRVEMLLRVLEKRETIRMQRIGLEDADHKGLGTLVNELREECNLATRHLRSTVHNYNASHRNDIPDELFVPSKYRSAVKFRHSTEALANLYAQHLRVARREGGRDAEAEHAGVEQAPDVPEVVRRLEAVLRRLGISDEAAREKMKQTLVDVARRRAAQRDEARLAEMHTANEEKRRALQTKINRAVALGWVCEGNIDLISTFRSETAPTLHAALEAEQKRVVGYVDALRESIVRAPAKADASFTQEVQHIMGTSRLSVDQEVRDVLERISLSEKMVSIAPHVSCVNEWPEIKLDTERNARLLERKSGKIQYGMDIAEEVSTMLGDIKKLKTLS